LRERQEDRSDENTFDKLIPDVGITGNNGKKMRVLPDFEAPGYYEDREIFQAHESLLSDAEDRGRLRVIRKPRWYNETLTRDQIAGAEAYYECRKCRAVWHVLLPERAFSGYIEKIR
jgi:hypothetical protein